MDGLLPSINTQEELNELEKANIRIGLEWAKKSRILKKELLTYSGLFLLHKNLFGAALNIIRQEANTLTKFFSVISTN